MYLLNKKPSYSISEDSQYKLITVPVQQGGENLSKDSFKFNIATTERENNALRTTIVNLERENEIFKSTINTLILSKRASNEDKTKESPSKLQFIELRSKVNELTDENERLREDMIKIKEDMFKRYEQLQKSNDELLISYEKRVHFIHYFCRNESLNDSSNQILKLIKIFMKLK